MTLRLNCWVCLTWNHDSLLKQQKVCFLAWWYDLCVCLGVNDPNIITWLILHQQLLNKTLIIFPGNPTEGWKMTGKPTHCLSLVSRCNHIMAYIFHFTTFHQVLIYLFSSSSVWPLPSCSVLKMFVSWVKNEMLLTHGLMNLFSYESAYSPSC